jgi:hypothetical protein
MTPQEITVGVSIVTLASAAMNVYIGLRLTALQAQSKADNAALETRFVTQLSQWKDEVLATINGKYVSGQLIAEIRTSIGRELAQIELRLRPSNSAGRRPRLNEGLGVGAAAHFRTSQIKGLLRLIRVRRHQDLARLSALCSLPYVRVTVAK